MPNLPPTPKPGEVWENDGGERRCIQAVDCKVHHFILLPGVPTIPSTKDEWLGWAIRTNARVVLQAKEGA
jgi:hypothetical protein